MSLNLAKGCNNKRKVKMVKKLIVGEYRCFWRLEYWSWFLPHPDYDPVNHGRIHLIGNFYWRK